MRTKTPTSGLRYEEIASLLRNQIASGALRPGDRLPSYARMHQEYGTASYTVDRVHAVLESDGLIVRQHRRGVYVSDPSVRPKTGVLAVYFDRGAEQHPCYGHIWQGIRQVADQFGRELLFLNREGPESWDRLDGLLMCESNFKDVGWTVPPGIPAVGLLRVLPGFPSVNTDNREGTARAVRHLLELGHRKIACLTVEDTRGKESVAARHQGYVQAMLAAGIEPRPEWTRDLLEYRDGVLQVRSFPALGYEKMRQWLKNGWGKTGCTAVLAQNDGTALGIIKALREAGMDVPGDVSVMGFDGTEIAEYSHPTLTTIEVPWGEIGATGTAMLIARIDGAANIGGELIAASTLVLSSRLKPGESTGPAPRRKK